MSSGLQLLVQPQAVQCSQTELYSGAILYSGSIVSYKQNNNLECLGPLCALRHKAVYRVKSQVTATAQVYLAKQWGHSGTNIQYTKEELPSGLLQNN